jgi:hypothetical protein
LFTFFNSITAKGKKLPILKKVMKPKAAPVVCMLCWNKNELPVIACILCTQGYNPSNCKNHVGNMHNNLEAPGLFSDVSTITRSTFSSKTTKKETKQSYMTSYQQDPNDIATPQIALSFLYQFFNEANVAIAQANNEHLKHFIDYILENAHQLRARKADCFFSRYKYMKQRDDRFLKFVSSLKELVIYSRDYYKEKFNKEEPFLCVSHDGWDSKDHDILGVCVHFVVPGYWKVINLAVGLKRVRSKKSRETAKAIFIILER